jgi:thiamine-phosphate pyrophosphorylase
VRSTPSMRIPLLYPILDADALSAGADDPMQAVCRHALALADAGCTVLQYRAKRLDARESLAQARELRRLLPALTLIMNDRADLCLAADFDGVHVGQDDLSPESARAVVGAESVVGFSTHNPRQLQEALGKPVSYVAIGPVFATTSKSNADPVVGLEGVAAARRLRDESFPHSASPGRAGAPSVRSLPLVAIGGITLENAAEVLRAGADALAVIGCLSRSPRESAREFFRLMM